ncbi:GNAT family N-acetyltransferase [Luteibacter sp. PPL201]|uniref:GNAT family N-acetyltransferase n=1 Tax=Luteibacter sahnii TaxID=3021977 RepID=A0ABT6B8V2_9GAMM|nr:GNAT family N-acetyltransferase [Luteibacter sp. PPL193]MDY1547779.1 GNAT family N-acetyltransferase [Luteibacter sp. PPL193]
MRHTRGLVVEVRVGAAIAPMIGELAALRIAVFRDWPYLYDGDEAYERDYLAAYAASSRAVCVVAREPGGRAVGASTGMPLADDAEAFHAPFLARGVRLDDVFYFGESVLLAPWRGRGVGHAFFDAREAHARSLGGFRQTAFCAVRRPADDPRTPAGHRGNEAFWRQRGYGPAPGMVCTLAWKDVGDAHASEHTLDVWVRPLETGDPA